MVEKFLYLGILTTGIWTVDTWIHAGENTLSQVPRAYLRELFATAYNTKVRSYETNLILLCTSFEIKNITHGIPPQEVICST